MRRLEPLKGLRRWFHRKCGITVRGNVFILDGPIEVDLLVVGGTIYCLTIEESDRVKRTMGVGTVVESGTFSITAESEARIAGTVRMNPPRE